MVCKKTPSALLEPPNASQLEIILKDTNETSEDKLKHNERLMHEWINCQDNFPKDIDSGLIRGMLRGNKHILERTKQKLEQHLAARHLYPEMYTNRSPFNKDLVQAMDVMNMAVMPKLTPKGHRIFLFGINRPDPSEFNVPNIFKLAFMMYELIISSDTYFAGDIAIFDSGLMSPGHITKFFGPFLRTVITILKEAYSIRLKEIHIINAPSVLHKMMSVLKPILHIKVRNSIYLHDNPRNIVDIFGADYLPSTYGGNLKPFREISTAWYDVINDNADWFESQEHIKISGITKKVHSKFYVQEQLGVEGSFRKLEID